MAAVGEVVVEVYRMSFGYSDGAGKSLAPVIGAVEYSSKIHEKALKGDSKSHGITYVAHRYPEAGRSDSQKLA
jgi:hypothetical protein